MYFSLTFSTGTINTDTPMYINVEGSQSVINVPLLVSIFNRNRDRNKKYTSIR